MDAALDAAAAAVAALARLHDGELHLAEVVAQGDAAVSALGALLASQPDTVPEPRLRAARALAAIGTPAARDALRYALHDSLRRRLFPPLAAAESDVISAIARGLSAGGDTAALREDLLAVLAHGCHPGACAAAGELAEARAAPALVRCLEDDVARPHAAAALLRIGAAALPALRARLLSETAGDSPSAARAACARLLGALDPVGARPLLIAALADAAPPVRWASARVLAEQGVITEALPALLAALDAAPPSDAQAAAAALCASAEGRGALLALAADAAAPAERRLTALAALTEVGDARVVPLLHALATAPDPALRAAALRGLIRRGATAEDLRPHLDDPAAEVRAPALEALILSGDILAAARGLADRDRGVRLGVAAALARIGARRTLLRVLFGRGSARARLRAARLLLAGRSQCAHQTHAHE
ncbi:MAG: HEAT repeat domain-containing protein [Sinobacteraceae bacterium]|nr:HEAT repeat domain-containing protein [Nevskiaceae bacterium]